VRVIDRLDVVLAQFCTATLAAVSAAAALAAGASWARVALIAAGLVQLTLAAGIGVLVLLRYDRARALIIDGYEALPLTAIEQERNRLLSRRRRLVLAGSIEHLVQTAEQWSRTPRLRHPATRPLFSVPVVLTHAKELQRVAAMLRSDQMSARAVALVDRLLTSPGSPLYEKPFGAREEDDALARELQRIEAALSPRDSPTPTPPAHRDPSHA
jgi:hypothetical protein